jgi:hypothetical protein
VRNIYKYYSAHKLMLDVEEAQRKARELVAPTTDNPVEDRSSR